MKQAAIGIIYDREKTQVLLIKRRDVPVWVLPGGGIEPDETEENAVLRELFEETGLTCSVQKKIGTWYPTNKLSAPLHVFECVRDVGNKDVFHPQEESKEVAFWPISDLPKYTFFLHEEILKKSLQQGKFPIIEEINISYWKSFTLLLRHPIFVFRYILSRMGIPFNT